MRNQGSALPETIIVLIMVALLMAITFVLINPLEKLRKTRDTNRIIYSTELLRAFERFYVSEGRMPEISPAVSSVDCPVVVKSQPVANLSDLHSELSSWLFEQILRPENSLYVGFIPDKNQVKICHKVEAEANVRLVQKSGCSLGSEAFTCVSD
ncbi:MAG: hypothetical protein Q8Q15_01815 [bacterium]|nr:hypothetical protein [bacterium]